jgi:hypothetical protein
VSGNTAYLPGVGFIVDPQLADYRASIRFLRHKGVPARQGSPAHPKGYKSFRISQRSLCDRLIVTARRLEWTPRRLAEPSERERTVNKRTRSRRGERTMPA